MPAGVTAPIMADRSTKRHKGDAPMGGPPGPDGYHGGYGQMPPQGRYQQPPYGGPSGPPMGPQSGYMGWQHGQYGNPPPPPPHSWGGHASPPPPGAMYPQRGGPPMTPDRAAYSGGYRGPPPAMQGPGGGRRSAKAPGSASRPSSKASEGPPSGAPDGPPSSGYQGGWSHPQGPPQGGQWPQHQWGGGPPPGWQGSGPGMHQSGPGYGAPGVYGGATSPARGGPGGRPRASPELYSGPPGVDMSDMDMCYMTSRSVGPPHDDDNGSIGGGANSSSKDKGRGSYKCGRCGVPKKGHVCPYQPKLTRRPGEPMPEMRSASIQVEMDEFMTMRRLNLKIQGFPESYATEPYMDEDMVIGEPHPLAVASASPPSGSLLSMPDVGGQAPHDSIGSPIRSSPITEDPILGEV